MFFAAGSNSATKTDGLPVLELTEHQFQAISELVKSICGINLHSGKKELVKARLNKRLRKHGLSSFRDYIEFLRSDTSAVELTAMLDAISTNLTSFFREMVHFEYLMKVVWPRWAAASSRRLRIWSAGCSSGEEPYSLAMSLLETVSPNLLSDAAILATDLSTKVLAKASEGLYPEEKVKTVAPQWRSKYFHMVEQRPHRLYQVSDSVRQMVRFARLNLMESWPMRGPFDVIFCSNVMIYFEKDVQNRLIERYWNLLADGGLLFIGHSESLAGVRHNFKYVQPTVYQKA